MQKPFSWLQILKLARSIFLMMAQDLNQAHLKKS